MASLLVSRLLPGLLLASLVGCSALSEDTESDTGQIQRTDPSQTVTTSDPAVGLLRGYNAFLDRATATPCVEAAGDERPVVGNLREQFTLTKVTSKEDLAKQLEVDVELDPSVFDD